jgi:hypothetical protein
MSRAIDLSHLEFDVLWEDLGLGEAPYPIKVPSAGETQQERAELRREALAGLADRGLHDGRDPHRQLEDMLVGLARHRISLDGQLAIRVHLKVLAAAGGGFGVIAVQAPTMVRLEPVSGADLVAPVMALIPDIPPAQSGQTTMPRAVFHRALDAYAGGSYTDYERALQSGGVTGRDLRAVTTLIQTPRFGGGQLAANSVDQLGRRKRSAVLNWFDTEAGRFLLQTYERDGEPWLTLVPADGPRLTHQLTELVSSISR